MIKKRIKKKEDIEDNNLHELMNENSKLKKENNKLRKDNFKLKEENELNNKKVIKLEEDINILKDKYIRISEKVIKISKEDKDILDKEDSKVVSCDKYVINNIVKEDNKIENLINSIKCNKNIISLKEFINNIKLENNDFDIVISKGLVVSIINILKDCYKKDDNIGSGRLGGGLLCSMEENCLYCSNINNKNIFIVKEDDGVKKLTGDELGDKLRRYFQKKFIESFENSDNYVKEDKLRFSILWQKITISHDELIIKKEEKKLIKQLMEIIINI
tara:strand:+ start:1877 stop:2701 length:825 start_codon:yes stop_codon:yes gene_type:complete